MAASSPTLLRELREWWASGFVDPAIYGPTASVSLVADGALLVEAEQAARRREPGNGLPQRTVLQQLDAALA